MDDGRNVKAHTVTTECGGNNSVSIACSNIDNQKGCASSLTSLHPKGPQLDVKTENQVNSDLQQQTSAGEEPKPRLLFVEVFAGSAKLSSTAYERGFRTLAIDHGGNQHEPHHEIAIYDLTSHAAQSQLLGALEDDIPSAMHMAPPCGTCSRAREKPLPELGKHAPGHCGMNIIPLDIHG